MTLGGLLVSGPLCVLAPLLPLFVSLIAVWVLSVPSQAPRQPLTHTGRSAVFREFGVQPHQERRERLNPASTSLIRCTRSGLSGCP